MTFDQAAVFAILGASLFLFVWGRLRYDIVALLAMLATVVLGLVEADAALAGFGHPAVITVAAVLVISQALRQSGLVDVLSGLLGPFTRSPVLHVGALTAVVAVLSAFMNNVGALAVMLPVAVATAVEHKRSPAIVLMPLAFGSILGGLVTLVGTPPNVIIAAYRTEVMGAPFRMFDFSSVGAAVAVAGILFVALVGWRLIPRARRGSASVGPIFEIQDYLLEMRVKPESPLVGKRIAALGSLGGGTVPVGLVRGENRILHPAPWHLLSADDVLILRGDPDTLPEALGNQGLELVTASFDRAKLQSETVGFVEAVVTPGSPLIGRNARFLHFRTGDALTLIAISREGAPLRKTRLRDVVFMSGDVLLLQAERADLAERLSHMGLLPLAERDLVIGNPRQVGLAVGIFALAVAANMAELLPIAFAFIAAAVAYVIVGILPARDLYRSIDWSVIVLLGAMFSVGEAMETTGAALFVATSIVNSAGALPPLAILAFILVVTMCVSDLVNNAATAVLMAPIAVGVARTLDVSADPFLMAVAVGASCAFLTPIGHQSNTLVMSPGGYKFSDYWRMGLPLEIIIALVAVPLIAYVWPLEG